MPQGAANEDRDRTTDWLFSVSELTAIDPMQALEAARRCLEQIGERGALRSTRTPALAARSSGGGYNKRERASIADAITRADRRAANPGDPSDTGEPATRARSLPTPPGVRRTRARGGLRNRQRHPGNADEAAASRLIDQMLAQAA